jgi:hypothetical protein
MKNIFSSSAAALFLLLTLTSVSSAQSIDGAYVLESRIMADGTVIKPPQITGLYNLEAGYINFNQAIKDASGKVQSVSYMGKYRFTPKEYYQEIFFVSINDEIGGGGIKYDFGKKSGTSPVKITGGKIEFPFPPNNKILATFDGRTFKASTANRAYTDNWKKVK